MERYSIIGLANRLQTEADAYLFLEELRWNGTPVCSHCGSEHAYYLKPMLGIDRKTTRGTGTQRRVWKCAACRKQFSVLTGTIFHGTHIPLRVWVLVIFEMSSSKNGVSAREIERKYNLTPKSAWFLLHRIREAMKLDPLAGMLAGTIIADETYIGGLEGNKHKSRRKKGITPTTEPTPIVPGAREKKHHGPQHGKTTVLSLISTETGEVRSKVIPDVTGATLRKAMADQVNLGASTLMTDENKAYRQVAPEMQAHHTVNHSKDEYVRHEKGVGRITTNAAEGYFSQLKRSLDGTHHHVSATHLDRYLAEFDYRYSTRKLSDTQRMRRLLGDLEGKRLSYRPLTGR
jgi:transposase-like protein